MRVAYRVAYRVLQAWTFLRRPAVRGTMVAVLDASAERVLLVRHTYGDRRRWELPGGWMRAGEPPAVAARREVAEELGVDVVLDGPSGLLHGTWDFKSEALAWFAAPWPGGRGSYDPVEIAEVAWFSLDALPEHLGEVARRVLDTLAAPAS
jgi:8-oxo-dGTP pyrophosphatase MutT (NUDIX family)